MNGQQTRPRNRAQFGGLLIRPARGDCAIDPPEEANRAAYGWPADLSDDALLAKLLALNLERAGNAVPAHAAPEAPERDEG